MRASGYQDWRALSMKKHCGRNPSVSLPPGKRPDPSRGQGAQNDTL